MFLLALFAVLATSFVGWCVLGISAVMVIWLVARIHQEFSGGSGTKKLWPTIWFLTIPTLYLFVAAQKPATFPDGGQAAVGFVANMWAHLTVWNALGFLGSYVGIGLLYSLFEMRVTLWRDKKSVVTKFEGYIGQDIKKEFLYWLNKSLGSSQTGNEDPTLSAAKTAAASAIASSSSQFVAVEVKFRTWLHLLPEKFTLAEAFIRNANPKVLLAEAEQAFKDDVAKFEAGLKEFLSLYNHASFNPYTAYLELKMNTTGALDVSIKKADLTICLANWTFWWPGYGLNFVFGDMFEAIFTRLSAWIVKIYGGYVQKYFADIMAVKV
jgi:hypothetical protein